jgi:hypothetical protein
MRLFKQVFRLFFVFLFLLIIAQKSVLPSSDPVENIRRFTRRIEFDYITWTLDAFGIKAEGSAINYPDLLNTDEQHALIEEYITIIRELRQVNQDLVTIFSDPSIKDPKIESEILVKKRDSLIKQVKQIGPSAESILQRQISSVLYDLHLTTAGTPFPSVLYHSSPLPFALIVSPRETIRQDANISIIPEITIEQMIALENNVSSSLNVSALVEEVGGIGTYPTMVQETDDLNWLLEVISHEWIHNYLELRPLGINYDTTPELRTMNETTASLAGKEIASSVIARYYPERVPPPPPPSQPTTPPSDQKPAEPASPPAFDFRAEMHITRLHVDELLAAGKIDDAEAYMEQRRQFLWDNGYQIRKLNQAYFAFHGAYADEPGGAAGNDPVGPAVRALRDKSASLFEFINRIAWFTSFDQLQRAVQ